MADLPMRVAVAFVEAINAADLEAMRGLMTDNHTFTDALGNSFSGADEMIAGWRHFLHAYPGYRIRVDHGFADASWAALYGRAEGKWRIGDRVLPGHWSVASAWLAEIEAGRVRRWRVYCDTGWVEPPGTTASSER